MRTLRTTIRALLLIVATVVIFSLRMAALLYTRRSDRLDRHVRARLLQAWTRFFAWVAGIRVVVEGPLPQKPFFIVANHVSYIDMLVLSHQTACIFVSRGDVEHWPVIGFIARRIKAIFIDRADRRDTVRVNKLIEHAIAMGDGVAVFPESRISAGRDVAAFKSALIEPAVALKLPVHYATINYETLPGMPPAHRIVGWWRPESFFFHIGRMLSYPGFIVKVRFCEAPLIGEDRKELSERLRAAVREHFVPLH